MNPAAKVCQGVRLLSTYDSFSSEAGNGTIGIVSIMINASFCEFSNMIAYLYEFTVKQFSALSIKGKRRQT